MVKEEICCFSEMSSGNEGNLVKRVASVAENAIATIQKVGEGTSNEPNYGNADSSIGCCSVWKSVEFNLKCRGVNGS